jgi:hypothetical protein
MIAVPAMEPVSIPDEISTEAIAGDDELHVPPGVASDKAVKLPAQSAAEPTIGASG